MRLARLARTILALGFLAVPLAAEAQPAGKVYRVGWLAGAAAADSPLVYGAFLQGRRDHGYTEGSNLIIERRTAQGDLDRLPALAAELVRLHVDVIVATTSVVRRRGQGRDDHHPNCDGEQLRPGRTRARGESRGAGGAMSPD